MTLSYRTNDFICTHMIIRQKIDSAEQLWVEDLLEVLTQRSLQWRLEPIPSANKPNTLLFGQHAPYSATMPTCIRSGCCPVVRILDNQSNGQRFKLLPEQKFANRNLGSTWAPSELSCNEYLWPYKDLIDMFRKYAFKHTTIHTSVWRARYIQKYAFIQTTWTYNVIYTSNVHTYKSHLYSAFAISDWQMKCRLLTARPLAVRQRGQPFLEYQF